MAQQKTLLTADQFFDFCDRNDGRYELVDGEVVELAPVFRRHGRAASNIDTAFNNYCRRTGAGWAEVEVGYTVRYGPDTVRGPDVSLVLGAAPDDEEEQTAFIPGAPDIAVEVVSPSNTAAEIRRKVAEYLAAGSQRVWAVYAATRRNPRRVIVHRADGTAITYSGNDVITDEELLPGFSLSLSDIFD